MHWGWVLLLGAFANPASAQTHAIDSDATQANFWIRTAWIKRIEGTFPVLEGVIERQPQDGSTRVDVRIDIRALQMSRASYVTWAQSPEFFDVQRHPWMHFQSDAISAQRLQEGGSISGQLTLRGVTRPIQLQLEPASCTTPGLECPVHARAEVKRSAFGMEARRLALGDTVHLNLVVRLQAESAP